MGRDGPHFSVFLMQRFHFPTLVTAGLITLSITVAHAQGLGGLLNQAKEKINKASQAPSGGPTRVEQAAQAAAQLERPVAPPALTADSNDEYTRALYAFADRQTFHPNGSPGETPTEFYWYCWLREKGFSIKFTWDRAVVDMNTERRTYLSPYVNLEADDLVSGLMSVYGSQLKPRLAKVKEIHFTTSPKERSLDDFGTLQGFFFSFDPGAGVLTAAMSQPDGAIGTDDSMGLTKWIIKYIK